MSPVGFLRGRPTLRRPAPVLRAAFAVVLRVVLFLPVDLREAVLAFVERALVFLEVALRPDDFAATFFRGADFGADIDLPVAALRFGVFARAFCFAAALAGAFAAVLAPAFFAPTVLPAAAFLAADFAEVVRDADFFAAAFLPDVLRAGAFAPDLLPAAFLPAAFLPVVLRPADFAAVLRGLARIARGWAPSASAVVSSVLTSDDSCSGWMCLWWCQTRAESRSLQGSRYCAGFSITASQRDDDGRQTGSDPIRIVPERCFKT